jgi:hypothetical protein
MFRSIITSPYLSIIAGIALLLTASYEIVLSLEESAVGVEHGIFVFAIVHIIKAIPEVIHAVEDIETGERRLKKGIRKEAQEEA